MATGGTTRARARGTPASGPTDSVRAAIAALADGREQGDSTRRVVAATVDTRSGCIGLAHGAKLLKDCLTIDTTVFVYRHLQALTPESVCSREPRVHLAAWQRMGSHLARQRAYCTMLL